MPEVSGGSSGLSLCSDSATTKRLETGEERSQMQIKREFSDRAPAKALEFMPREGGREGKGGRKEGDEGKERENNKKWRKDPRSFSKEDRYTNGSQCAHEGGQHYDT